MESSKYIDIIKKIIASKSKDYAINNTITPLYFTTLFPEVKDSIKLIIKTYGYPELDEITLEKYYDISQKEYLSVYPIEIDPSNSLTRKNFKTWLNAQRLSDMQNSWNYSERYFTMLQNSGRSEKVVDEVKQTSLKILEKIGDPKSKEAFYVKGLVVGGVQSGKTANFNAVINRAIDAGYGLIIVLSGLMEDLRGQTQLRIDNDIIGEGLDFSGNTITKGVGKIRKFGNLGDNSVSAVISVTSTKSDFKKSLLDADFSLNHTNILVCKNNVSVLRNLIVWLHDYLEENKEQHNIPLLVLDDEADNASLNNEGKKGREYASKTNGHIRALLALFKKKTYLGYTATPFANVLADRNEAPENDWIVKYKFEGEVMEKELPRVDNLFPDDFIVLLNPPTNYIGAKQIFETITPIDNIAKMKIPLVELVDDHISNFPNRVYEKEDGTLIGVEKINNKDEWDERFGEFGSYLDFSSFQDYRKLTRSTKSSDDFPQSLPDSLKESILCFILSIAIRESRKPTMLNSNMFMPHHSMLIHISRYTKWQNKLKELIDKYISDLQTSIELDKPDKDNSIYTVFEKTWYKYFANIVEHITDYLPKGYDDEFLIPVSFETLKKYYLTDAIKDLEVKAINSVTKDKLVYPVNSSKKVIAIGGNRLSRGFTLEGLTINYFVRTTNYSDALLQMGRWFGYRPGYLDCCKLFITNDSLEKYDLVTRTIEELEIEFRKMEERGKTPENFKIRVKKHPGTLKITRPNILKDLINVNWSYQDSLEQTTSFDFRPEKMEQVWSDFSKVITKDFNFQKALNSDGNPIGFLTSETDISGILKILSLSNNFNKEHSSSLIKFIELCDKKKKLSNWTIAIKTTGAALESEGKGILKSSESHLAEDIEMSARRGPEEKDIIYYKKFFEEKVFSAAGKSASIISGGLDMAVLLSEVQKETARKEFIDTRRKFFRNKYKDWSEETIENKAKEVTFPERIFREKMTDQQALMVIYVMDSYYVFRQEKGKEDSKMKELIDNNHIDLTIPFIGYAIGFPPIEPDPGSVYVMGNYGIEELEEELTENDHQLPDDLNEV